MTFELRRCAHCSGTRIQIESNADLGIVIAYGACDDCGATGPEVTAAGVVKAEAEAARLWNTRKGHENDATPAKRYRSSLYDPGAMGENPNG
jgi:hypothetical protein